MTESNTHREVILEISNLQKSFGSNKVLDNFNLRLFRGENLVVMGKSGSGKSVMVKCLVGLMEPNSGRITINNKDITSLNQESLDILRTEIGFLFQGSALYDSMTVRENLEFPLRKHKKRLQINETTEHLVQQALKSVGLSSALDLMPSELSGGMKRRVALARALILNPSIIIYDEPTTGLDPITAKEIIALMKSIQSSYGTSALIITHDVDCARVVADRIILLIKGKNYIEGSFQELSSSTDLQVRAFFK
ncbi:ABC transporter ATP-binding protein [Nonlabens sp.]|uniref:ABC transporter ATP-binding protein n=1 Tax=Nonlabens sp. TaxID=1888209 RepID=UPI001BD09BF6|nr:ATP-binding cassette domain-containing protein [Nonlabens sp.]